MPGVAGLGSLDAARRARSIQATWPFFLLGILTIASLLTGALIASQYGESIDEDLVYLYGKRSQAIYRDLFAGKTIDPERVDNYAPSHLRYYGPAYLLLGKPFADLIRLFASRWTDVDIWHLVNFVTFLLGAIFLYTLCARFVRKSVAFLAAALFVTQPLLWGHAFINPKDVPFMVFFTAAVAVGIQMADRFVGAGLGAFSLSDRIRDKRVILSLVWAGIVLGLCVSVRVLGPAAGLIVAVYLFFKAGWKSIPILLLYFLIAAVITFSTWPFLWGAPIHRFIESFQMMADFPWEGTVLFNGVEYPADQLPRTYLPALIGLQFTEPAILLFGLGLVGVARLFLKKSPHRLLASLMLGWFFLPILGAVFLRPVMYDNFRQFFFIIPPLFILAAIGLEQVVAAVKNRVLTSALVALIFIPGLANLVSLHPYQYVYYNGLAGGLQGAFRRFEMDYWMTSFRQAARFLNETAQTGARVAVSKHAKLLGKYAREDLRIEEKVRACNVDYVVINTRHSLDLRVFPDEPTVSSIGKGQAVFTVIRKLVHCKTQSPDGTPSSP